MHPILFRIGSWSLSSYGVTLAVAFLLVIGLLRHATTHALRGQVPLTDTAVMDWAVWTVAGGIIGGRLLYVALNWDLYRLEPSEIVALWHGGLVWYGGLAGGILGTAIYFRIHHYSFLRGMDQVIPFVPLGHAIGRIGCFLNGCCYGKPTTAWFGVQFPGHPGPVVPTQLIESASLMVLCTSLWKLQTPAILRRPGLLFGLYLIGYAVIRGIVEYWRADQPIIWAGLTLHQFISIGLLCVGAGLMLTAVRRHQVPHAG